MDFQEIVVIWLTLGLFFLFSRILAVFFSGVWVLSFTFLFSQIIDFSVTIILDFFSRVFIFTVFLISFSVFIFSQYYIDSEKNLKGFVVLLRLFVLSIVFLVISPNLLFLLLGWDGLGVTSYLLVVFYLNYRRASAGIVTFLVNRLGDVFFFSALAFFSLVLDWNFFEHKGSFSLLAVLLVFAFITKRAQIPFSSWLPAAIAAPTPVSSLVHSSTLVTAGVFLLVRFSSLVLPSRRYLIVISSFTILMAGIMARLDWDLKKVIAFSTLRQLGFMVVRLSCGLVVFCFFHMVTHAFFKASLFMCSGVLIHSNDRSQEYREVKRVSRMLPFVSVCIFICLLCLCGFPFSSGFFSKDLVLDGGVLSIFVFLMFLSGVLLTFRYALRFGAYTLGKKIWSRFNKFRSGDVFGYLFFPILFLVRIALVFGSVATELFFLDLTFIVFLRKGWKIFYWVVVGAFRVFRVFFFQDFFFMLKKYFLKQMWFLRQIFSQSRVLLVLKASARTLKVIDQGWWEIVSARGVNKALKIRRVLLLQEYFFFFSSFFIFLFMFF